MMYQHVNLGLLFSVFTLNVLHNDPTNVNRNPIRHGKSQKLPIKRKIGITQIKMMDTQVLSLSFNFEESIH